MDTSKKKQEIRAWARKQRGIAALEKYVLEMMAMTADPVTGVSKATARWIAERCNLNEQTVRNVWRRLQSAGLMAGASRPDRGIDWTLNLSLVTVPRDLERGSNLGHFVRGRTTEGSVAAPRTKGSKGLVGRSEGTGYGPSELQTALLRNKKEKTNANNHNRPTRRDTRVMFRIPVRDPGPDGAQVGFHDVDATELAEWTDRYPDLALSINHGQGVVDAFKGIEHHYSEAARGPKGVYQIKVRSDLAQRIRMWLDDETEKLARRNRGKGQQQITGVA